MFRAELRLTGVVAFDAKGLIPDDEADSLDDLVLTGRGGAPIDPNAFRDNESFDVDSVVLTWAISGAEAKFRGGNVELKLLEALECLESPPAD